MCVFATASDAHMRRYRVMVPTDCTASEHPDENGLALRQMARAFKADTRPSSDIDLDGHGSCFESST
jgi:nicotinamidase-related amidase